MERSSKKFLYIFYCNTQLWQNYGVVMAIVANMARLWQRQKKKRFRKGSRFDS